ncbi:ABC transporter ATP-binding protein [Bermanella marisrubri]|uniref:ABC-type multidrug transport system, ATPase and permease components n=1 Tax=Bermanella marisrubri TaxID=207949 RepID=Q1N5X3_9GAMM|nr:ABC transporter ATP-binding protein [Bermanella marisrubri]EAT13819.1 ABC-type multidrug transport system, ATPase and permease components [Oceanobacter sp. RED65] [Bermanella marisrubri]QIZ84585.1 ABC transporter ATP-binding protein [Bermanella marisrubri]
MFSFFERLINPYPSQEPQQPPDTLWAFCRHYTKGMWVPLVIMTVLTACLAMFEVYLFGVLGDLVDWLVDKDPKTLFQDEGDRLVLIGLMLVVVMPLLVMVHAMIVHQTLLGNFPMSIRYLAHRYLLKQSLSFYQDEFAGRIATKVLQTSLALRESIMKLLNVMVYILVYFTSMVFVVAQADWRMAMPIFGWLALYIVAQWYFIPKLKDISTKQADARSDMTGRIVDTYTNIMTVKLFSHNARETQYAKDAMDGFMGTVYKQMRLAVGLNVSVHVINYFLVFAIGALGIYLWVNNAITAGAIAIAVSLSLRLNGMAQWIMWEVSSLFENIGTVADGMKTLSKPQSIQDKLDAKPLTISQGEIHLKHVRFAYEKANSQNNAIQDWVFDDLDLRIKPGEKVGVVGRSGAGKSTLVNLLLRFYDVQEGEILIDGQNIAEVKQESLRQHIAMVTQDTSLLHRSVRDNILYGRPDATESEMLEATKQAQAFDFVQSLSDVKGGRGFDAQVGERGVKLSGGQRQRIAIARVLLKDAPILILDEATSALDSEVEAAIQESLTDLMQGKTVIAIAHRLSTIAAMDRLIVMDQGRIVDEGTHEELLAREGIYRQLWSHQTGGFLGDE